MTHSTTLRAWWLLAGFAIVAAGCAHDPNARYKLPPPRNTQPLLTAHGVVYAKEAPASPVNPTALCITPAGHCPLAQATESGLPCTCESTSPEYTYGGKTGPIPPMPDWADPQQKWTK
jgi:hypothetical protein